MKNKLAFPLIIVSFVAVCLGFCFVMNLLRPVTVISETERTTAEVSAIAEINTSASGKALSSDISAATRNSERIYPININTATVSELVLLDGIGEVIANRIVEYRTENGAFSSIEELKEVSGIGDVKFNNIKEKITV